MIKEQIDLEHQYYISCLWYSKWLSISDPGPISNSTYVCNHGCIKMEYLQNIQEKFTVVPKSVWDILQKAYGGGPSLQELRKCEQCENRMQQLKIRRENERKIIQEKDRTYLLPGECWYLIISSWLSSWHEFIEGTSFEPPGQINNEDLLDTNGRPKKKD